MSDTTKPDWHRFLNYKDKDAPPFHPGWTEADQERGVRYSAPWRHPFAGFPEHARRCALALAATGVPVKLLGLRGEIRSDKTDKAMMRALQKVQERMQPLVRASIRYLDAEVFQTIATDAAFMRLAGAAHHWMGPDELALAYEARIISTVFERDRLTDEARACLKRVRQVWVANDQDKAMLEREGVTEAHVVPIPFMPDDRHLPLQGGKRWPGVPRFLHVGKWEPRKEQRNIMLAFLLAFKPGQARLYVKTSMQGPRVEDYPDSPRACVAELLGRKDVLARGWSKDNFDQSIFVIQRRLDDDGMVNLYATADVYVTLSRGEGFDMPAFDAKLSGHLLVYTPSGGPQDFAGDGDLLVPMTGKVDCHPFYEWGGGAQYGDYALDDAVSALRAAAQEVEAGRRKRRGKTDEAFTARFSAMSVGTRMKQLLQPLFEDGAQGVQLAKKLEAERAARREAALGEQLAAGVDPSVTAAEADG